MNKKIATTIMMTMIAATAVLGMGLLSQQAHAHGPILICQPPNVVLLRCATPQR